MSHCSANACLYPPRPHAPDRDCPDAVHGQPSTAAPSEGQVTMLKTGLSPHGKKSSLWHAFEVNKTDICVLSISQVAVNKNQILFSTFSLKAVKLDHCIWAMLDLHLDSNQMSFILKAQPLNLTFQQSIHYREENLSMVIHSLIPWPDHSYMQFTCNVPGAL